MNIDGAWNKDLKIKGVGIVVLVGDYHGNFVTGAVRNFSLFHPLFTQRL